MKLLNDLKKAFIAHYFCQFKNNRFLILEGAFVYMLFACAVLTYGVIYHFNSLGIVPFLIPFAFGFYMFTRKGTSDINDLAPHWRTQLRALTDPRLGHKFNTPHDLWLEERLKEKWLEVYGEDFEDMKFVKLHKWLPLVLPIIVVIVLFLYT